MKVKSMLSPRLLFIRLKFTLVCLLLSTPCVFGQSWFSNKDIHIRAGLGLFNTLASSNATVKDQNGDVHYFDSFFYTLNEYIGGDISITRNLNIEARISTNLITVLFKKIPIVGGRSTEYVDGEDHAAVFADTTGLTSGGIYVNETRDSELVEERSVLGFLEVQLGANYYFGVPGRQRFYVGLLASQLFMAMNTYFNFGNEFKGREISENTYNSMGLGLKLGAEVYLSKKIIWNVFDFQFKQYSNPLFKANEEDDGSISFSNNQLINVTMGLKILLKPSK